MDGYYYDCENLQEIPNGPCRGVTKGIYVASGFCEDGKEYKIDIDECPENSRILLIWFTFLYLISWISKIFA